MNRCFMGLATLLGCAACLVGPSHAQQLAPQADPQDFGLVLPQAKAELVEDRRVVVPVDGDDPVVAQAFFEIGDHTVVMLPDGRLTSLPTRDVSATDRPFVAATFDELAQELTGSGKKFAGFRTRTTKRYLYVYNTSEPFFQGTSRILETMYPNLLAYCKRRKLAVHDPLVPLVVIMFQTEEEFQKYHEMPPGVVAYFNGVANHVVLYEQSKLVEIAPEMAVKQSISTIAHEGVHQILHNIGVQHRLSHWPMWISEGLPEYFAPTQVDKRIRWKGVGLANDLRMKELEDAIGQGGAANLWRETVVAKNLDSQGYAAAWALTHFFATRKSEAFFKYLKEVSQRGPLETFDDEADRELFERHFGGDFALLDKGIIKHLRKVPYVDPIANQTHFVAMLQVPAAGVVQRSVSITTSPASVQKWRDEELGSLAAGVQARAQFNVQAFPTKGEALAFAQAWLNGK